MTAIRVEARECSETSVTMQNQNICVQAIGSESYCLKEGN